MRTAIIVCAAMVAMAVVACSDTDAPACPDGSDEWVRYELFMGRSSQSVEVVDDAAWDVFLDDMVTPRFPDGLTVFDASGQWRGSDGMVQKERSKVLVILVPPGDDSESRIGEVSDEYKRRFNQESVLQVVTGACVSFQ